MQACLAASPPLEGNGACPAADAQLLPPQQLQLRGLPCVGLGARGRCHDTLVTGVLALCTRVNLLHSLQMLRARLLPPNTSLPLLPPTPPAAIPTIWDYKQCAPVRRRRLTVSACSPPCATRRAGSRQQGGWVDTGLQQPGSWHAQTASGHDACSASLQSTPTPTEHRAGVQAGRTLGHGAAQVRGGHYQRCRDAGRNRGSDGCDRRERDGERRLRT